MRLVFFFPRRYHRAHWAQPRSCLSSHISPIAMVFWTSHSERRNPRFLDSRHGIRYSARVQCDGDFFISIFRDAWVFPSQRLTASVQARQKTGAISIAGSAFSPAESSPLTIKCRLRQAQKFGLNRNRSQFAESQCSQCDYFNSQFGGQHSECQLNPVILNERCKYPL